MKVVLKSCFVSGLIAMVRGATCGDGNRGDGACPDPSLCCSAAGWCGTSPEHCGGDTGDPGPAPMPAPGPTTSRVAGGDSNMIAFMGNWKTCPTSQQLEQYTHVFISFATTYQWVSDTEPVRCDETCQISVDGPCSGQTASSFIGAMHGAGKKVVLSFGGAGMGGDWKDPGSGCWEHCYGREDSVVTQLAEIVQRDGYDGIDIDFEYYTDTQEAVTFLTDVTNGLRNALPTGSMVTHAPMDNHLVPGNNYFAILRDIAQAIDLVLPRYYNGVTRPVLDGFSGSGQGHMSAKDHYDVLVNQVFNGDATKVVFGFCNGDCSEFNSNADGGQAREVMSQLNVYYPCNGGAFFWEAAFDSDGSWSSAVNSVVAPSAGCSSGNPVPAPAPTGGGGGTCGNGSKGNGVCPDTNECCSEFGWCGSSPEHCGDGSRVRAAGQPRTKQHPIPEHDNHLRGKHHQSNEPNRRQTPSPHK